MNLAQVLLATLLAATSANAAAQSPAKIGLLPLSPSNSIVGHWQAEVTLGPCTGGPAQSFVGFNTYHAGGTLSDTGSNAPPSLRGPGHGIWQLQRNGQYKSRFQIQRFQPTGEYDGYADIRTTIVLHDRGRQYAQTIQARNFRPDGSLVVELCGNAAGRRIAIE